MAGGQRLPRHRLAIVVAVSLLAVWAGQLLAATTTYTGVYTGGTISASDRLLLNNGASVTGNVVVNGTMQFNQTGALTLSNTISGSGTLSLTNTGTLTLLATNTNSETTLPWTATIASGRLQIGPSGTGRLLMREIISVAGGTLVNSDTRISPWGSGWNMPPPQPSATATITSGSWVNSGNLVVGAAQSRSGVLEISGSGFVAVGGTLSSESYTWQDTATIPTTTGSTHGIIHLGPGGTLQIGLGGTTGVLSPATFTSDGTLAFNRSDSTTYAGVISGSGGVVQMGSGTMTLSGNNSYTGPSRVLAGVLVLSGSLKSPLDVSSGTLCPTSRYAIYGGNTSSWTASNITIGGKGVLSLDTNVFSGDDIARLTANGTGTSGFMNGSTVSLDVGPASTNVFRYSAAIIDTNGGANSIAIQKTGSGTLILSGSNTYTGGTIIKSGSLQVEGAIRGDIMNNGVLVNYCSSTANWTGAISGTGSLVNKGGTVVLSGSNTYSGPTRILGGELWLPVRQALYGGSAAQWTATNLTTNAYSSLRISVGGTGEFTASDIDVLKNLGTGSTGFATNSSLSLDTTNAVSGTFVYAGSFGNPNNGRNSLTIDKYGAGSLVLLGSNSNAEIRTFEGTVEIGNGGTSGSVSGKLVGSFLFNRSDASVYAGNASVYSLKKAGRGLLTLTGSTSCGGTVAVSQGGLEISKGGSVNFLAEWGPYAKLLVGNGAVSSGSLRLDGGIVRAVRVEVGGNDGAVGALTLVSGSMYGAAYSDGSGSRDLGIYISRGEMDVYGGRLDGYLGVYEYGRVSIAGGEVYGNASIRGTAVLSGGTWSGAIDVGLTSSGSLAISGGMFKTDAARFGVSSTSAVGIATIAGGTCIASSVTVGDVGVGQVTMTGGSVMSSSVVIGSGSNSLGTLTLTSGTWSNSGKLSVGFRGEGLLTIGGGTSKDALLVVGQLMQKGACGAVDLGLGGTLQIGTGGTTGDLATDLTNNGTLVFNRSSASTYSGALSGSGALQKRGSGALTLANANALTGSTTIQQGTLQLAHASALSNSTISPLAGGTLSLSPGLLTSIGGLNPNAGGLIDIGTGEITVANGLSVADLATALQSGLGNGSWNGTSGITSSAVASSNGSRTVGWLDNGDGSLTFGYAAIGDTNLDWTIDMLDVVAFIASGKLDSGLPATWRDGDFNYDGVIDVLDVSGFLSTGLFDFGAYNAPAGSIAAVPEPSVMGLVGVGAGIAGLVGMRRKRAA